jgi:hypothetical protein
MAGMTTRNGAKKCMDGDGEAGFHFSTVTEFLNETDRKERVFISQKAFTNVAKPVASIA